MAISISSAVHPFVTKYTPKEIEDNEQHYKNTEVVYLHNQENEQCNNVHTINKMFVGLQKVEISVTQFDSIEPFFLYLRENINRKFYVVLLKALSEQTVSELVKYVQVASVFQFDSIEPWIKEESLQDGLQPIDPTITEVLYARHRLMHSDIAFNSATKLSIMTPVQDFIEDSRSFIKYQILMELLLNISFTEKSKQDFMNWSLENYGKSLKDKQAITKFDETFKQGEAIYWYTTQSFAYRILSRTFATNDLRRIFTIRYFISHLYTELKILHVKTFAELDPTIIVYRGKTMSEDEFIKFKTSIGKLVITKCFISTSLDIEVARMFSGDAEVRNGDVAVIFRMKINKNRNKSKAFAFIGEKSCNRDEAEFLLGPGIIFLNYKVDQIDNMFIITLIHTKKQYKLTEKILQSKDDYLRRARDITSDDDFLAWIDTASNPLQQPTVLPQTAGDDLQQSNPLQELTVLPQTVGDDLQQNNLLQEQVVSQQVTNQPVEQNTRLIELIHTSVVQQQRMHQTNEHTIQAFSSSTRCSFAAAKRLFREVDKLRSFHTRADGPTIFIFDEIHLNDENTLLPKPPVIICRILPCSDIYNQAAYQIEIRLPSAYPLDPPEVRFLTPIYHPNVDQDGIVCMDILQRTSLWATNIGLADVLTAVVHLIDHPDLHTAIRIGVAREYIENRAEFNRKALDMVKQFGLPRK